MSLAEKARSIEHRSQPGPVCSVTKIERTLSDEDAEALRYLIHDRLDLTAREVCEVFLGEGIEVSVSTITRHRNNACVTCRRRR